MEEKKTKFARFIFILVTTALLVALSKAGILPAIPEDNNTWFYFTGYAGAGIIVGLAAYEGWHLMK